MEKTSPKESFKPNRQKLRLSNFHLHQHETFRQDTLSYSFKKNHHGWNIHLFSHLNVCFLVISGCHKDTRSQLSGIHSPGRKRYLTKKYNKNLKTDISSLLYFFSLLFLLNEKCLTWNSNRESLWLISSLIWSLSYLTVFFLQSTWCSFKTHP